MIFHKSGCKVTIFIDMMKLLFLSFQKMIMKIIAFFEKTIIFAASLLNLLPTNVATQPFNHSSR